MKMPKPLTLKEKAAAFDRLCDILHGKAKFVHRYRRPVRAPLPATPVLGTAATQEFIRHEEVVVYEWVLRADGTADFEEAMTKMVRKTGST